MLQQIVTHTPVYVWAILGLLVVRGVAASRDRMVGYRSLFIMPAVMLVLALHSIASRFGWSGVPAMAWLAAAAAGVALAWKLADGDTMVVERAQGKVLQRGSWVPLALMMAVFIGKYALAVVSAMRPALAQEIGFAAASCAVFGLFNGVFIGRMLRGVAAFRSEAGVMARAA